MPFPIPDSPMTDVHVEMVKRQLVPLLDRMSREQLFDMGDYFYAEARHRGQGDHRHWCYEIRV